MCMCESLQVCMYVGGCAHLCPGPMEPEEGIGSTGTGVTEGGEPPYGC